MYGAKWFSLLPSKLKTASNGNICKKGAAFSCYITDGDVLINLIRYLDASFNLKIGQELFTVQLRKK